jgi:simple sugar transport system ATP-binding protein
MIGGEMGEEAVTGAARERGGLQAETKPASAVESTPSLVVEGLGTPRGRGRVALQHVTLTVDAGEICGVAGVDGNGQGELADALYGLAPRDGIVRVGGTVVPAGDVVSAQHAGIALIPADRRRDGIALGLRLWENVLLSATLLARFTHGGILDVRAARAFAAGLVRSYRVVAAGLEEPVATLSGGNQQRIVVGRALAVDPRVLVAVNPTRGLDIVAAAHVRAALRRAARQGTAILLVSTDLDELLASCTRVFALYRGRLLGPTGPGERDRLGALMSGLPA